jgi:hypothetical protein
MTRDRIGMTDEVLAAAVGNRLAVGDDARTGRAIFCLREIFMAVVNGSRADRLLRAASTQTRRYASPRPRNPHEQNAGERDASIQITFCLRILSKTLNDLDPNTSTARSVLRRSIILPRSAAAIPRSIAIANVRPTRSPDANSCTASCTKEPANRHAKLRADADAR